MKSWWFKGLFLYSFLIFPTKCLLSPNPVWDIKIRCWFSTHHWITHHLVERWEIHLSSNFKSCSQFKGYGQLTSMKMPSPPTVNSVTEEASITMSWPYCIANFIIHTVEIKTNQVREAKAISSEQRSQPPLLGFGRDSKAGRGVGKLENYTVKKRECFRYVLSRGFWHGETRWAN